MPVSTRNVTYVTGTQPSGMAAGGEGLDLADAAQDENKPKNELQKDKTPPEDTPGPRTPSPGAHALAAELADVEYELKSAKKTASELRNRILSQQGKQSARRNQKSSTAPSPPPRPRIEGEPTSLDMGELGKAISELIKGGEGDVPAP